MTVQILRKKFTVGQYRQMIESGILTDRDRVELLQGEIIEMSPVGRQHAACVDQLTELLVLALSSKAIIRVQNPIRLSNTSEPQPELTVLQRRTGFYRDRHPQPKDVFAVVEVSDTTVEFDRTVKIPLYAQEEIPEAWIVDLKAQTVEVYREPSAEGYLEVQTFHRGQSLRFQSLPDAVFFVDQILN
jgi:Uma2 family endonuclease